MNCNRYCLQNAINKVRCNRCNNCCCALNNNSQGTVSVTIGTVTTGEPGSDAIVTNSGTAQNVILNFTIPRGDVGLSPELEVGEVTTGAPGSDASVEIIPNN